MLPDPETIRAAARESASQIVGKPVKDGQKIVSSGWIDSLSVLRLIGLLEKKLNISIPPESLQPEDFDDIETILETVERVGKARS